ncbi:MAG: CYTH domain-containing protein [Chitinophagaceae bacterium]|nr:CYTH domain-containing protein [Chitinophagaceae bacterium]
MPEEIERKFLVTSERFIKEASAHVRIVQGYLSSVPERNVRVRIKGEKAFITIKGIGNNTGTSRFEFEKEITITEAEELLRICEPGIIDKTRYEIKTTNHVIEVDVFHGENEGLIIAEIELADESETYEKPAWLGEEVTGTEKYYNASLTKFPYKIWTTL